MSGFATKSIPSLSSSNFDEFNSQLQAAALKATRNAAILPADVRFHRTMDESFARDLDALSQRALALTNRILILASTLGGNEDRKGMNKLEGQDDVVDKFQSLVVDPMDQLLERTDTCLDHVLGKTNAPAIAVNAPMQTAKRIQPPRTGQLDHNIQHAAYLPKPQLAFQKKPDNSDTPWSHSLNHKYNAQVPLGYVFRESDDFDASSAKELSNHPYIYEIKHISYPSHMFTSVAPIPYRTMESTPLNWVRTPAELESMLDKLRVAQEIAVDLEHHDYRTYAGFLCLMQISTREEDWIVDLLLLRKEIQSINEVFTNPAIVKVLHGAENDTVWLQQNFSVYIVNLFDTFHASKLLEFPRHGLAQLLEMYCDFVPDKRYQLADWRIRPLPEDMIQYARSDTHFLLFIYDNLRNALLDRANASPRNSPGPSSSDKSSQRYIREVLSRSEETALRVYSKESYDYENGSGPMGWDNLAKKWNKPALYASARPSLQKEVFRTVHAWRDNVAREEDESVRYVLPNHFLFRLAEEPPADRPAFMRVFANMPPVIRNRQHELLDVIRDCVKSFLQASADPAPVHEPVVAPEPAEAQDVAMQEVAQPRSETSSLWARTPKPNVVRSSSSFGSSLGARSTTPLLGLAASSSSLFGDVAGANPSASRSQSTRFQDAVAKIHNYLVVVPSVPSFQDKVPNTTEVDVEETITEMGMGMQIEVPYVPAQRRQTKEVVVDSSIVVVGQARQKKRKRTKSSQQGQEGEAEKSTSKGVEGTGNRETAEPFDFSGAPNILDEVQDEVRVPVKKKKSGNDKVAKGAFYGNFPAPPKAPSELRSGNKSLTFK